MGLVKVSGHRPEGGGNSNLPPLAVGHREAARHLAISERTLHTLVKNGEVVPCRIGGRRVYLVKDLMTYLESKKTKVMVNIP